MDAAPAPAGPDDPWYAAELESARSLGILDGLEDDFKLGGAVSREDMMVMLANALRKQGIMENITTGEADDILSRFTDSGTLSPQKREAAALCVKTGFIAGDGEKLMPKGTFTRAQAAKILSLLK